MASPIKDLVYNENGEPSSSKFWFNIANAVITFLYVVVGLAVARSATLPIEAFAWLTLVYAGVVATNKFAIKFLEYKYNNKAGTTVETSTVVTNKPAGRKSRLPPLPPEDN